MAGSLGRAGKRRPHGLAATDLRLASAAAPRLACNWIAGDSAETPANDVALVATNPARNERDLQVRPGLSVQPEPVETVGIEPTSATARKTASTSVAGALALALRSPTPAGLRRASLKGVPRATEANLSG